MIRLPSVAGVDAAGLPSALKYGSICFAGASARQASFPSARLYAMVYSFPASNAVIMRLSPATIGDERPEGADTFHLRFLSGPNSTGGFWPSATPDPFGPRNRGHTSAFSAARLKVVNIPIDATRIKFFMLSHRLSSCVVDLSGSTCGHYRFRLMTERLEQREQFSFRPGHESCWRSGFGGSGLAARDAARQLGKHGGESAAMVHACAGANHIANII